MRKKSSVLTMLGAILAVVALFWGWSTYFEKESKEAKQFNVIMDLIIRGGVPTAFDKNDTNPFKRIYATNGIGENDGYIDYEIYNEKNIKSMSYTVYNSSSEYDNAKKNGEKVKLDKNLVVYAYSDGYYWHDIESGLYRKVASLDWETTNEEQLKAAALSIGESKFDIKSLINYNDFESIVVPTYKISESENKLELTLEYDEISDQEKVSVVSLFYDDIMISQSNTFDYTSIAKEIENIEEVDVNGSPAYIESIGNGEYIYVYYEKDGVSTIVRYNQSLDIKDETTYKDELIKVLKSMNFK